MSQLKKRYEQDGIWTNDSPRTTCVVPEWPLMITGAEELALNQLTVSTWNAIERVVEYSKSSSEPSWNAIRNGAQVFPQQATMPPAVRIDTIRTDDGFKIVEIDPVSAISIGETVSLIKIWQEQGFDVPDGLLQAIASKVQDNSARISTNLPTGKQAYSAEIAFLVNQLQAFGIETDKGDLELSAFNEDAGRRRAINKQGWLKELNPLWGSLIGMSDKTNLSLLIAGDKKTYPSFLPASYSRQEVAELDPATPLIVKPQTGTGSMGVRAMAAGEIDLRLGGYVYQEQITPLVDDFGECVGGDAEIVENNQWVSRISVYAGRYGLLGVEVTARPLSRTGFTNAHGQSDAVQTTVAIK